MKITVLGSGGWGLASAMLLDSNGHDVTIWCFDPAEAKLLREEKTNSALLPGVFLTERIGISTDISCSAGADMIVMVTPSFAVYETAKKISAHVSAGTPIVVLSKGIDSARDHNLMSQSVERAMGGTCPVAVLTGPSHAEEVARKMPTAVVAACADHDVAVKVQKAFMNEYFRVYTTDDVLGAQLGGALKNIIAIACGISDGLGFGDNTRAMLMTRGIAEISRLGIAMGGRLETFSGLSGVGDIIVTCTSLHSRNYRAGRYIGEGLTPDESIKKVGAVVEGYYAAIAAHELSEKMNVDLPIFETVYGILCEKLPPLESAMKLIAREGKPERDI